MREVNAMQIQEELRLQRYVTIPWLQVEYDLSYTEAKEFLRQLILRGWVEPNPKGIRYGVQKKKLCLRKIQRDEVDGLIADLNNDCVLALTCLDKQSGGTLEDLEGAVRGDDDTEAAIRILTKHKLIYQAEDMYFLMVSKKTVQVISDVEAEKRRSVMRRKLLESKDKDDVLKKMFDVLFED